MRRKRLGYIWIHKISDHNGRHIHVYKGNREVGVYDLELGPIRGLEKLWSRALQEVVEELKFEIDERNRQH